MAPGSSGFGKDTVRKVASGVSCSSTTNGCGYPASLTMRDSVSQPTPCIAVYTQRIPVVPAGAGATAAVAAM